MMHSRNATILTALAAIFLSSAAYSADLGSLKDKQGDADFSLPSVVNFSGFYVQGQAGYLNANHDVSVESPSGTLLDLNGISSHGFFGGGRVGYDFARGRFLFGPYAEYNWDNAKTELSLGGTSAAYTRGNDWTVGARAGVIVAPRTLVYGLVGYTQTQYEASLGSFSQKFDYDGVTAGGGVEFALASNIFAGLEVSHTWYNDTTLASFGAIDLKDGLDETKAMATLKIKLNGFGN